MMVLCKTLLLLLQQIIQLHLLLSAQNWFLFNFKHKGTKIFLNFSNTLPLFPSQPLFSHYLLCLSVNKPVTDLFYAVAAVKSVPDYEKVSIWLLLFLMFLLFVLIFSFLWGRFAFFLRFFCVFKRRMNHRGRRMFLMTVSVDSMANLQGYLVIGFVVGWRFSIVAHIIRRMTA